MNRQLTPDLIEFLGLLIAEKKISLSELEERNQLGQAVALSVRGMAEKIEDRGNFFYIPTKAGIDSYQHPSRAS